MAFTRGLSRLDLQFGDASVGDCGDALPEVNVITWVPRKSV